MDLSLTKKEITVGLDKRDDECSLPSSFLGRKIESLVDVMWGLIKSLIVTHFFLLCVILSTTLRVGFSSAPGSPQFIFIINSYIYYTYGMWIYISCVFLCNYLFGMPLFWNMINILCRDDNLQVRLFFSVCLSRQGWCREGSPTNTFQKRGTPIFGINKRGLETGF